MQDSTTNSPSPAPPSFAGLLASLTAPTPRTAWNNDDLAEDVATLSYEHALRAHARYKVDDTAAQVAAPDIPAITKLTKEALEVEPEAAPRTSSLWTAPGLHTESMHDPYTTLELNKKCASITIRLSKTECDQLRRRAAQAGLTVSAYLRSCTFEAEVLRAQVKEVLAELRQSTAAAEDRLPGAGGRRWFQRMLRFMPGRQRRLARA